jgi:magnesium-protoporphyrin O-methyltransferase
VTINGENRAVPSCCVPQGEYRRFFRTGVARRDARRFRKKGLDAAARRLVDAVAARGIEGARVLEAGGGVGAVQLELLAAGAATATGVELSSAYEEEADALARERRVADRVERRVGDFVELAASLPEAEVVVLHRAVCCYPDGPGFVAAAAGRATRVLALTFPRERAAVRLGVRLANAWLRLRGCGFRAFVHPARDLLAAAPGFTPVVLVDATPVWRIAVLERAS